MSRRASNDIERQIMGMMQDCIGENEEILQERAEAAGKEAVRELRAPSRKD